MTALYIISFILLVVATIALLKLTPEQINKDINELFNKQQTLKDQALMARGKKRKNRLILELERIRRALQETGKEKQFSLACTAALLLMVAGCIVAIAIDNMFLIPVLAIAFALIPFAYFDYATGKVQLGDVISVTLTTEMILPGFGGFELPFDVSVTQSGLSRMYWK